jgi:hypothetical protein
MYLLIVTLLMFLLPMASIAVQAGMGAAPLSLALVGQWFVFWSVGVRLVLAGLRQVVQPGYTAKVILALKHDESNLVIRELGFANLALGTIGIASVFFPAWIPAAALAGGVFYMLAGIQHTMQPRREKLENIAMVSDLFAGAVLLASLLA